MNTASFHASLVKKLMLVWLCCLPALAWTQIGIGTTSPHPSSMLHISAGAGNNKGLIIPKISSGDRMVLDSTQNIAHGLMLFDTVLQKFYYFHNAPRQWFELDHDWIRKDVPGASAVVGTHIYLGVPGNVGIGTAPTVNPSSKLTVVGKTLIGSAGWAQDSVPSVTNGVAIETWLGIGTATRSSGSIKLNVRGNQRITGGRLIVDSTVTATKFIGEGVVPAGGIIMWSGTITGNFSGGLGMSGTPYEGWALCDGRNGTPDLRGRFVVGMRNGDGNDYGYVNTEKNLSDYDMDDTGGEREHTLTEQEMPAHDHTGSTSSDGAHSHNYTGPSGCTNGNFTSASGCFMSDTPTSRNTTTDGNHTHSLSINDAGGGDPHENRPPFYALAFIMRLN